MIKIILLGDSAVGKSKLVERFLVRDPPRMRAARRAALECVPPLPPPPPRAAQMNDYQPRQLSTYALTLFRYVAHVSGEQYNVDFWDTAGQERFNSMHPAYYHQAHACVLCFDVTRKMTYKNLPVWLKELHEYRPKIPIICIANKVDVDRAVMSKDFAFPKKHGMQLYFCSAADGTNVVAAFEDAIARGVDYSNNPPEDDFLNDVLSLLSETQSMRIDSSAADATKTES